MSSQSPSSRGHKAFNRHYLILNPELWISWENSPHLATLPLVSPRNEVWETSAEIPYWSRVITHTWVILVFWLVMPRREFPSTSQTWLVTRHQYVISAILPQTSFHREGSGGVAKQSIKCEIKCLIELLPSDFCLYREAPIEGRSAEIQTSALFKHAKVS